jgi:hypothetical protein
MNPPFTVEAFLAVFAAYNAAIWPIHFVAYGLGAVVVWALFAPAQGRMRLALAALAVLWAVTGIGYHLMFFARINPIAPVFAAFFVVQAGLFAASAAWPADLRFRLARDFRSAAGLGVIIYAVAIYPVLGIWAGHGLMAGPMFGVAPCPTTIFTIGILLIAQGRWVLWLSVIPILWSLIGLAAALQLGIPEDLAMPLAGCVLAGTLGVQAWQRRAAQPDVAKDRA